MKNQNALKYRDEMIAVGLKIGYLRRLKGLTQEQLAEKANLSVGYIGQIEAPRFAVGVSLSTLFAIAEGLEVPASKLLEIDI